MILFLFLFTVYIMACFLARFLLSTIGMIDDGSSWTQEVEANTELNIPGNEMLEVKLAHFPDPFHSFKLGDDEEE